jgi:hypothetical protein
VSEGEPETFSLGDSPKPHDNPQKLVQ